MFPIGIDIFPEYEGPEPIYTEGDMYIDFSSGGSVYIKQFYNICGNSIIRT